MAGSAATASTPTPSPGHWPVDPQEDVPVDKNRIWVDGCFDFSHHGHAGAMLQARRLGTELLVGVHSDEAILENKGPTVMTLKERIAAVNACRWSTKSIPHAPYVTSLPWISHYGCEFVVHGDDITSDSSGEDCYRFVKAAGRFKVVKRTPGISTTDLVGRMLLCTKGHFIRSLEKVLAGEEGSGSEDERIKTGAEMRQRIQDYATDETGLNPGSEVWYWHASKEAKERRISHSSKSTHSHRKSSSAAQMKDLPERKKSTVEEPESMELSSSQGPAPQRTGSSSSKDGRVRSDSSFSKHRQHRHRHGSHSSHSHERGTFSHMVHGRPPRPGQRVVYVDGGFDLFSSGHIEFLRLVVQAEENDAKDRGWYTEEAKKDRIDASGEDFGPVYLIAGIHDDEVINHWKGINYPIMNIFERGLCVLQCKYVHAIVLGAPFTPSQPFLSSLPYGLPATVYHGPTAFMPLNYDPYTASRSLGIFKEIPVHDFQHVNAGEIVERIMRSRARYEERQRMKGEKGVTEEATKRREDMEREAKEKEKERLRREVEGLYGV